MELLRQQLGKDSRFVCRMSLKNIKCVRFRVLSLSLLVFIVQLLLLPMFLRHATYIREQPLSLPHKHFDAAQNYLLLLNIWERMVNIQYAIRRFVNVALDANFTLIEPFVYQSKVPLELSLPELFHGRNLSVQAASTYFDSDDLYNTQRYEPFHRFQHRFRSDGQTYFIHVVLFLTWGDRKWTTHKDRLGNWVDPLPEPFFWCDSNKKRLPGKFNSTSGMYHLSPSVQVGGVVCADPSGLKNASFFHTLFDIARTRIDSPPLSCSQCASVAVANYRKHAVRSYTKVDGVSVSKAVPPLSLAPNVFDLASEVVQRNIGTEPYVAIQLRTGKAYTMLSMKGRFSEFERWLDSCVDRLLNAAREKQLPIYVATDLFNDGWLGGETAKSSVHEALRQARDKLSGNSTFRLKASDEHELLTQDHMGMASAIDAAASVSATHFIFADPSNFGGWVRTLRNWRGKRTETVSCPFRSR